MRVWIRAASQAAIGMAAAAALVGCGGGGSDAPDAPAAPVVSGSGTAEADVAGATCGLPEFRAGLLARVNQLRAAGADCGSEGTFAPAGAVAWNDLLTQAALGHSQDMVADNYFAHTSPDGTKTLSSRVTATGYAWSMLGENIAAGQRTVNSVMDAWMASPGHCANVMRSEFTEMGVACVTGRQGNTYATYWTMELGRPAR